MAPSKPFSDLRREIDADPVRRRRVNELTGRLLLLVSLGKKRPDSSVPPVEGQSVSRN